MAMGRIMPSSSTLVEDAQSATERLLQLVPAAVHSVRNLSPCSSLVMTGCRDGQHSGSYSTKAEKNVEKNVKTDKSRD
jgi:hypothetical protein